MRQFDDENDDEIDEFYEEMDDDGMEPGVFMEDDDPFEYVQLAKLKLSSDKLDLTLLKTCIKMLENGIFWKFYSPETKLMKIHQSYHYLNKLLEDESNLNIKEETDPNPEEEE